MSEWGSLRRGPMQRLRQSGFTKPLASPSASELATMSERIDHLAMLLAQLSDSPLTVSQRERLSIIARELLRRARG